MWVGLEGELSKCAKGSEGERNGDGDFRIREDLDI